MSIMNAYSDNVRKLVIFWILEKAACVVALRIMSVDILDAISRFLDLFLIGDLE